MCLIHLEEGKPKHWPHDLKNSIIDQFIQDDAQIQHILRSKEGLWSTVVGFVQWLLWVLSL